MTTVGVWAATTKGALRISTVAMLSNAAARLLLTNILGFILSPLNSKSFGIRRAEPLREAPSESPGFSGGRWGIDVGLNDGCPVRYYVLPKGATQRQVRG